jgi:hypothetical protein
MKTKSFQLEDTVPGSFFFQGLAGGVLGGFIFVVMIALLVQEQPRANWVIPLTPVYMIMGAIVGVVLAALLWGTYRITRLQIRELTRVAVTTILIGLISGFIYYKANITDNVDFAIGVAIAWFTALPVALLVGSRVKPWEFFTFGSMATSHGTRIGSRSVLASLGTLPLRVLSITGLVVWTLTFLCVRYTKTEAIGDELLIPVPLAYLLVSTYLTFRSPRKLFLLVIGILLNVPTAFLVYMSYTVDFQGYRWGEEIPMAVNWSGTFLVAWVLFLAARLCVGLRTRSVPVRPEAVVFYPHKESDHHCLGSRFSEWHEHLA